MSFWGVGAAVPVTPFGAWSFDLTEDEARALLVNCPTGGVLVSHSPPYGHVDSTEQGHLGSHAVLEAIERTRPLLVVCGHIHASWRQQSSIGTTRIINAGPGGMLVEI